MSLTTTLKLQILADQKGAADLGTPGFPLNHNRTTQLANGTGSNQADLLFSDQRTLGASATEDLELAGSLTDALGATLTFAKVRAIMISASPDNANNVEVMPAAANGFLGPFADASDQLDIPPGGRIYLEAPVSGWDVTAGTADLLTITNSAGGTGVTYDVIIVGASA